MPCRLGADRVGGVGIAGEEERLAAAAAVVPLLLLAGTAGFGHPGVAAVTVEAERFVPDVAQAVLAHVGKLHRQLPRAVTRQRGAVGGDVEEYAGPAAHAGLRPFLVVVGGDEDQLARIAFGGQPLAVFGGDPLGALQLGAGRQQPGTIQRGPAVELASGEFDVIGFQLDAQLDDPLDVVDVVPVGDEVEHHRIAVRLHRAGHRQFLGEGLA